MIVIVVVSKSSRIVVSIVLQGSSIVNKPFGLKNGCIGADECTLLNCFRGSLGQKVSNFLDVGSGDGVKSAVLTCFASFSIGTIS